MKRTLEELQGQAVEATKLQGLESTFEQQIQQFNGPQWIENPGYTGLSQQQEAANRLRAQQQHEQRQRTARLDAVQSLPICTVSY